ncbi:hypothetical protein [Xanthocytophaga agilis]|uniref:Uncharacterized protein n=1 Tax=Xanthocytophaga agilis TaxID=3048010 RepID=A0AAE3UDW3_9BACT|nr:hypothetical protein [Xanthocytophaga agilis]MDJ1499637.1 hypothetical protein [Xanthocytophaga agilis]
MLTFQYDKYKIEVRNDSMYTPGSADNSFQYDFIYTDKDSILYQASKHGIKVYKYEELYQSAIVCAVGGATGVYDHSAIVDTDSIYICCANKVFSMALPDLTLNWIVQTDHITCFSIYSAATVFFTHGELQVSKLDRNDTII